MIKYANLLFVSILFNLSVYGAVIAPQQGGGTAAGGSVNATNAARFAYGYRTGPVAISARTNVISYATQTVTSNFLYNGVGVFSNLTAGYYEISGGFNYYAVSNDTIKILIATNGVMADNLIAYSTYESTAGGGALGTNFVHISGMVYLPAVSAIASYIDYAESIAQTLNYQGAHLIIRPIDSASASATTGATGPAGGVSETNANQFGASTTLTLKDGVKLTNAVNEGIAIFNGDSSNRANLIIKGATNPKLRLTSVSPPQVLQLSSTAISTDSGGGQAYITISPEDYPTLRINTNSLEAINSGYDLGTALMPWGTLYASSFIGSGTGVPILKLQTMMAADNAFAITVDTNYFGLTNTFNFTNMAVGQQMRVKSVSNGNPTWEVPQLISGVQTNTTSVQADWTGAELLHITNSLIANVVIIPTNMIAGRSLRVIAQASTQTYTLSVSNAAGTVVLYPFASTNGGSAYTVTNGQTVELDLMSLNGKIHAAMGRFQ